MTAWDDYREQLAKLWESAGKPSGRRLQASGVCAAHSTINDLTHGRRLGSWPLVRRIVSGLGGDVDHFEQMWRAARQERDAALATAQRSGPVTLATLPVIVNDLRAAVNRGRTLHAPREDAENWCRECNKRVPCPTISALEAL